MKKLIVLAIVYLSSTACQQTQPIQKTVGSSFQCQNKKDGQYSQIIPETVVRETIVCKGGEKHGPVILYHLTNKTVLSRYAFKHNKEHGKAQIFYSNGQLKMETFFKNGEQHGTNKSYFNNGTFKSSTTFEHGKKNGSQKDYYPNNYLSMTTSWLNGERNGMVKSYDTNGNLNMEVTFKRGVVMKWYEYTKDGHKVRKTNNEGKRL